MRVVSGYDHSHGPSISAGGMHRKRLLIVLGITSTVLVAELVGARVTGSLAPLADAGHMFTDVAGIVLAILAVTFASRPPTPERTFGYYRLEILAAVVNAVLLFGVALYILWEAWQRWNAPPEVEGRADARPRRGGTGGQRRRPAGPARRGEGEPEPQGRLPRGPTPRLTFLVELTWHS